ncbi:MAG TPA: PDZ domain-containing protein, partial [Longimicrobium sp.]|nr:PDZ domain-containing protein [Longimicrobium sp.]
MSLIRRAAPILTLIAAASPLVAQTPPDPLSAAKHVTARYELYAPTQQDVDRARPYVERAIEGFGRAFGEPAPRVAVVLFDANPVLAAFDEAPLARRGLATRKWLTEQASAQRSTDLVAATPLGVVVGSAPGGAGVRVVAGLPGDAAGVGLQPGDVIKRLNGTAVATLGEFAGLFDALAVGAQAKLEVDRGGTIVQVAFAKNADSSLGRLSGPAQGIRGAARPAYGDILAHETAHTLLDAYVQSRRGTPPVGDVGRVPSWLHEAVAQ